MQELPGLKTVNRLSEFYCFDLSIVLLAERAGTFTTGVRGAMPLCIAAFLYHQYRYTKNDSSSAEDGECG